MVCEEELCASTVGVAVTLFLWHTISGPRAQLGQSHPVKHGWGHWCQAGAPSPPSWPPGLDAACGMAGGLSSPSHHQTRPTMDLKDVSLHKPLKTLRANPRLIPTWSL